MFCSGRCSNNICGCVFSGQPCVWPTVCCNDKCLSVSVCHN
jgi:hypothetical protein